MKRKQARFTVVVFLVLLFGLSLANALKKDTIFSENENRYLAGKPEWSVARFFDGVFGQEFETYLTDQFLGRDAWVSVKTLAELAMGKRESNHVFFAKDGYLIERHDASELASSYYEKNCSYLSQFIAAQTESIMRIRKALCFMCAATFLNAMPMSEFKSFLLRRPVRF